MSDVTRILSQIEYGDPFAAEQLLPLIYDELRALATAKMAGESPDHTLQPTALVHEAYIRLVDVDKARHWDSRGHFFAAAAEAMRRILVENARRKAAVKRGGAHRRIDFESLSVATAMPPDELLIFDEAIAQLSVEDEVAARLIGCLYFSGLSVDEAAVVLGISVATAYRHWAFARAWMKCELAQAES